MIKVNKKYFITTIIGLLLVTVLLVLSSNNSDEKAAVKSDSNQRVVALFYDVQLPANYAEAMNIFNHGFDLSIKPVRASEQAYAVQDPEHENVIKYINAYDNTDVVMIKLTDKIKEDIILKKPGHPMKFKYEFINTDKYIIKQDGLGNIQFLRGDEEDHVGRLFEVFTIPAPFMIDANGNKSSIDDVKVILRENELTLLPNPQWLEEHPYPITLDPTVEIHILNTQSYPAVSGPWTVRFTTVGTAELAITGDLNNTVYGVDVEFKSLKCGDKDIMVSEKIGNTYEIKNWSCDEVAYWTTTVLKAGKHHQTFNFGGQIVDAYNSTTKSWWNGSWTRRRQIWFDTRDSATTTDLTNFPAAVILNSGRVDYGQTKNLGEDIRFVDTDGSTQLDYEIEDWDEAATSIVWVEVPQINQNSDLDYIWMYYGNSNASDNSTTTGVWDENFMMVQHLQEATSTDADNYVDSTRNYNHGQLVDADSSPDTGLTQGKVDGGMIFNGNLDHISVADSPSLDISGDKITLSAWLASDFDETSADNNRVVDKGELGDYRLTYASAINDFRFRLDTAGVTTCDTIGLTWTAGDWHYITATYDGTNQRIFWDSAIKNTCGDTGNIDTSDEVVSIGAQTNPIASAYDGVYDEVRISNIARDDNWIEFEYCNMADTCTKYGAEDVYTTAGMRMN